MLNLIEINSHTNGCNLLSNLAGPVATFFLLLWALFNSGSAGSENVRNHSGDVVYYTDSGHAEFTSSVPLHTFTGKSEHLTGMIDLSENVIDFYLDLSTLKTGIGRRDRDMYRTLKADDHPFAEFTGRLASGFDTESEVAQKVTANGELTLSGVTRQVMIDGQLTRTGSGLELKAEWIMNIRDHDIEPPGILFYRVDDEMAVRIRAELETTDRKNIP